MASYKDETSRDKYFAPETGFYHVSAVSITYRDTGRKQWVENYDRKWFQFWKPKTREIPIMERIDERSGNQTVFLNKGDEVQSNFLHKIEGPK